MRGPKISFCFAGILFLILAATLLPGQRARSAAQENGKSSEVRSDIVTIDRMARHGKLELPAVTFLHDRHTEALEDERQPCLSCHEENEEDKQLDFTFKNVAETDPGEMKDAYHQGCISCHEEYLAKGEDSGPAEGECRSCHSTEPPDSNRQPMAVNKVLHFRHIDADEIPDLDLAGQEDENCGQCHHSYDASAGELVPESEEEGSCRYCHEEEPYVLEGTEVTVKTLPMASHLQCVNCHRDLRLAEAENTGPEECSSCHGIVEQKQIDANNAKILKQLGGDLPRLERGQPDAALVTALEPKDYASMDEEERPRVIAPVPFDHLSHERSSENCRSCHHESIESCNSCHSIQGKEEGDYVQLADAMHTMGSKRSCVGCHEAEKEKPVCAGCHAAMEQKPVLDEATCSSCHEEHGYETGELMVLSKEGQNSLAESMVEKRKVKPGLYPEKDIPEKVTIGVIADEYEPSEFPHRRIVEYLAEKVGESGMGGYFHRQEGLLCQGCHHNSPVSAEPPSCVSCHGKPFDDDGQGRPGIKAAYHGQCMDCHSAMGIEGKEITKGEPVPANTDCTGCHAEKK